MKFEEALLRLKNGEKIRRKFYDEKYYIYLDENGILRNSSNSYVSVFSQNEILADDWEVCFTPGMFVKASNGCTGLLVDIKEDVLFVLPEVGGIGEWRKEQTNVVSDERYTLYAPIIEKIRKFSARSENK